MYAARATAVGLAPSARGRPTGGSGSRAAAARASRAARRCGVLGLDPAALGAERLLPFRQPPVERSLAPGGHPGPAAHRHAGARVPGRRTRAELHLHRGAQARDGVHRRRPTREPRSAPALQGALRALRRPCGFRRTSLRAPPSRRAFAVRAGCRDLRCRRARGQRRRALQRACGRTDGAPDEDSAPAAHGRRPRRD